MPHVILILYIVPSHLHKFGWCRNYILLGKLRLIKIFPCCCYCLDYYIKHFAIRLYKMNRSTKMELERPEYLSLLICSNNILVSARILIWPVIKLAHSKHPLIYHCYCRIAGYWQVAVRNTDTTVSKLQAPICIYRTSTSSTKVGIANQKALRI